MLKKLITVTLACAATAAVVAYFRNESETKNDVAEARGDIAGLREWNSTLAREIVRSHRDARDVCIAVLTVNGIDKAKDSKTYTEIESKLAKAVRGSDLLSGNDTGEFFVLFPEAGLDEGYEAVERLQEALPPSVSLAAGIAVWDHCETAAEFVARAVNSMRGESKTSRAKIGVAETPQTIAH